MLDRQSLARLPAEVGRHICQKRGLSSRQIGPVSKGELASLGDAPFDEVISRPDRRVPCQDATYTPRSLKSQPKFL